MFTEHSERRGGNQRKNNMGLLQDWAGGITSGLIGTAGNLLGLPEMGYSEKYQKPILTYSTTTTGPTGTTQTQPTTGGAVTGSAPTGQVLGTETTGGDTGSSGSSGPSYEDILRGQIESGYSDYFNTLDQMLNSGLAGQQKAQQDIASNSLNTSLTDLGLQKTENQNQLDIQKGKAETGQVKTLKDIASNIRNLMQGANNYLGDLGAGDSSAVNQYAYALTKLGSEQFGNVKAQTAQTMQDIQDKESTLNNIYLQEKNKLQGDYNNQVGQIAQWFSTAQNQILQAKANGQLAKSQDLQSLTTNMYNQALAALQNIQNQTAQRQATLESWAASNATTIGQLKQNMAQVAQYTAQNPTYSLAGATPKLAPSGGSSASYGGYAGLTEDQKRLLGMA